MQLVNRPAVLRLLALVALTISTALLADGFLPESRLCAFESECDIIIRSWLGRPFGIPLAAVGAVVFAGLFALSLSASVRSRQYFRPLALIAGLGGAALIAVQLFVIRRACPFCLVVDGVAVLLALLASFQRGDPFPDVESRLRGVWLAAALACVMCGFFLVTVDGHAGHVSFVAVPPQVKALWTDNKVNVVEIFDFQCPHCRKMHPILREILAEHRDSVHYSRVSVPMPSPKSGARYASRAYLCAEKQHKGAEMAERLLAMRFFTQEACGQVAASVGLSIPEYRACVADEAIDRRLDADLSWVKDACPEGLPVIWIQNERFSGVQSLETLRAALQRAQQRRATENDK